MATRKPKPDPLHARPDGTRLRYLNDHRRVFSFGVALCVTSTTRRF